jgi:hypothetical protein
VVSGCPSECHARIKLIPKAIVSWHSDGPFGIQTDSTEPELGPVRIVFKLITKATDHAMPACLPTPACPPERWHARILASSNRDGGDAPPL